MAPKLGGSGKPLGQKSPREILTAGLTPVWQGLYAIPALTGYGEHWYLDPPDAKEIAIATADVVLALPEAKIKRALELAKQWGPLAGLAAVLIAATTPRVLTTMRRKGVSDGSTRSAGPAPAVPGAGDPVPPSGNGTRAGARDPDPVPRTDGRYRFARYPFGA